nr:hypothetical protein CFP56_38195 [Quercus suber]
MAAFKALKKERKLSKLRWLILSQLSKHIQKSHAKPTTHRNSQRQKSISNPICLEVAAIGTCIKSCGKRGYYQLQLLLYITHAYIYIYTKTNMSLTS